MQRRTRNRLAVEHGAIASEVAGSLMRRLPRHWDSDDVQGLARLALVEALDKYDRRRGRGDLQKDLRIKVRYMVLDYTRGIDHNRRRGPLPVFEPLTEPAVEHDMPREVLLREVWEAAAELPARWRQVLILYYRERKLMREIGEVMGINESRVSQIHEAAIARLREALDA